MHHLSKHVRYRLWRTWRRAIVVAMVASFALCCVVLVAVVAYGLWAAVGPAFAR